MCFQATEKHPLRRDTEWLAERQEHTMSGDLLRGPSLLLPSWGSLENSSSFLIHKVGLSGSTNFQSALKMMNLTTRSYKITVTDAKSASCM